MRTHTLLVPEISCATCKAAIEGALAPLAGVHEAVVDVATKRVSVEFDESDVGVDQLVAAIENQGFHVDAIETEA
jgi:copper chaperone CopZ